MRIEDEGIVLLIKKLNETGHIISIFSRDHGVVKGFVRSKNIAKVATVGCLVNFTHSAKTEDQLGSFSIEKINNVISLHSFNRNKIAMIESIFFVMVKSFQEKDAHPKFYNILHAFINELYTQQDELKCLHSFCLVEKSLLDELGYGLDLERCAVTHKSEGLSYISPKTGRAVIDSVGFEYKERLFVFPQMYKDHDYINYDDVKNALMINEYFISSRALEPFGYEFPQCRKQLGELEDRRIAA